MDGGVVGGVGHRGVVDVAEAVGEGERGGGEVVAGCELGEGGEGVEGFRLEVLHVIHGGEVVAGVVEGAFAFVGVVTVVVGVVAGVVGVGGGGFAVLFADAIAGRVGGGGGGGEGVVGDFHGDVVWWGG